MYEFHMTITEISKPVAEDRAKWRKKEIKQK